MSAQRRDAIVRTRFRYLSLAVVCVLAVAACGDKEQAAAPGADLPAAGAAPQVVAPAAPEVKVSDLIELARKAEREERLVAPAGDNAIEYYLQVLGKEAGNTTATQALVDLLPLATSHAEREIKDRNLDEAGRIIGMLDQANPGSYFVSTLRSKLNAERTLMQREEERRVAQEETAQQRAQAAQTVAQAAPAATPATAPARATAQAESRPAETAAPTPPPVEPAPVAQPVAESRDPVLVRQVRPSYPAAAARRKQEGWVEVSFTVSTSGAVSDVSVERSQPRGVFDRDAVRAVSQWQFEPALDNGKAVSRKLTRRIEFALKAQ